MKLFLDTHFYISVIKSGQTYSCQVMELIHGIGMYPATINDNQEDVVGSVVYKHFSETNKTCVNLQEVGEFHKQCLLELENLKFTKQVW